MSFEPLVHFSYIGTSNGGDNAYPDILKLPRRSGTGAIEYVLIQTTGSNTIIYVCHGRLRALDRKGVDQWAALAAKERVSVVLHNYPGYGETPGPKTIAQISADTFELAAHIRSLPWAAGHELVALGNSLGTGPAAWVATQEALGIKKLVLVSPYTSLVSVAPFWLVSTLLAGIALAVKRVHAGMGFGRGGGEWRAPAWWRVPGAWIPCMAHPSRLAWMQGSSGDPFPPIKVGKNLLPGTKVLVVHGKCDTIIPMSHSEALVEELRTVDGVDVKLCVIAGTDHRDTRVRGNDAIFSFIRGESDRLESFINQLEIVGHTIRNEAGTD